MSTTILTEVQIQCIGLEMPSMPLKGSLVEFARAIEQAVLQSEQVQRWKRDTERIYDIENERILIGPEYEGGWFAHVFGNQSEPVAKLKAESLRDAIDAVMEKKT